MINHVIRVLVVEDSAMVGEMIRYVLERQGYGVVGVITSGLEALAQIQSLRPDVVLMDIELLDLNGIEVTRRICEECPTPVVMLTAYDTPELVQQASAAGAGAYLVKPPRGRDLERAITIAMARFEDMAELRRLNAALQAEIVLRRQAEESLRQTQAELEQRVQARTAELARANEEQRQLIEDLDAYAHTVAHDLNIPLAHLITAISVLEEEQGQLAEAETRQLLTMVSRNGRKLSTIVNELLRLAEVRGGDVEKQPINMVDVLDEARLRLAGMIEQYQPEISLASPAQWPVALGYAPWIEEVWFNYLSNAIKYGGRPPRIEVGAALLRPCLPIEGTDNVCVQFWVRDNGPGLSPEEQARLFTPFTRFDKAAARGHGLGLSIVRRIVEKMGGQVSVQSQIGQGSMFSFTLPMAHNTHG